MKKILLFFFLAILVLPLAASAGITVSSPSGSELIQGANQPITWSLDPANPAAKFNLSLCTPPPAVGSAPVCRSIRTNIGITTPPYIWKVNKLLSGNRYRIEVCPVDRSGCAYSAEFNILPPALKNQQEVLNLFKTAMANRYADLNSNAKSGAQGVYDYIIASPNSVPPKLPNITKEMVNNGTSPVYARTSLMQLDWFKTEFLKNTGGVLETKDKAGIKYAMSRRYSDLCAAEWNTAMKNATGIYNTAVANAEKARKGIRARIGNGTAANPQFPATGEQRCLAVYEAGVKVINITPNLYNSATRKFITLQGLQNEKDLCLTAEYETLYDAKVVTLGIFNGALTAPTIAYNACIGTRISDWGTW